MQYIKQFTSLLAINLLMNCATLCWADTPPLTTSLDLNQPFKGFLNYSQNLSDWGVQLNPAYDQPIVFKNPQMNDTVRQHYFGENSVWQQKNGEQIAKQVAAILAAEKRTVIANLGWDNPEKQNADTQYDQNKITALEDKMDLAQFTAGYQYDANRRAIIVKNANTRLLPTNQGYYKDSKLPGEGADFEYIQNSATWAGAPVYILGYSKDKAWDLVWTTDCIGWVEAKNVAPVDQAFIDSWTNQIATKGLVAIIKPAVNIVDKSGAKQFLGYVGMILPLVEESSTQFVVMIPESDSSGNAVAGSASLSTDDAAKIPYSPTPRHFVNVMQNQLGRSYTWGGGRPYGESNAEVFYNDASAEMKYLFMPFGIYLPRHSADQVEPTEVPGRADDYTKDAAGNVTSVQQRIDYLKQNGHPFLTLIGGVAVYLGNYENSHTGMTEALAYHNLFGITPSLDSRNTGLDVDRRAVVGKAFILPVLGSYPEDPNLSSFVGRGNFKLMYLDDYVPVPSAAVALPNGKTVNKKIDIDALMAL